MFQSMVSCSEYLHVFMHFTLACRKFIAILQFDVTLFPYLLVKRTRRILQYSYLLKTLISSEYGLTISGHVTVLHQWPLEKTQTI